MLYDQAQLAVAYLDAFQITRDRQFEAVARDILDYVRRDMTAKEGGFFSAEDADSPDRSRGSAIAGHRKTKPKARSMSGRKRRSTTRSAMPRRFSIFITACKPDGNAPAGSDPHGEFRGKNILIERHTIAETAKHFEKSEERNCDNPCAESRETVLPIRAKRPRPHLDDKIITAWNGLMISAFARAAQVLDDPGYLEPRRARRNFCATHLYDETSKLLAQLSRGPQRDRRFCR